MHSKLARTRQKQRHWMQNSCAEDSSVIPDVIFTMKDHKPLQPNGLPKTRPICQASCTCQQRISEHLCRILKSCFDANREEDTEALSMEDMLSAVEDLNQQIREGLVDDQRIMIASLDVSALYPSIDTKLAAELVREEITGSGIKFDGIDWR